MSERIKKVNELIKQIVAGAVAREIDSEGLITVKAIDTTPDMRHATVWISVLGDDEELVLEKVDSKKREIQQEVNRKVSAKNVPAISFQIDRSGQYAEKIERLLKKNNSTK